MTQYTCISNNINVSIFKDYEDTKYYEQTICLKNTIFSIKRNRKMLLSHVFIGNFLAL